MVLLSSAKPSNVTPFFPSFSSSISSSRFCNSSLSTVHSFSIPSHLPLRPLSFSHSASFSSLLCRSSRPGSPPSHRIDPTPENDSGHLTGGFHALKKSW